MSLVNTGVSNPIPIPGSSSSSQPSQPQKLTKKQKKGLAFRERKSGKKTSKNENNELAEMEAGAIPIMEDQDLIGMSGGGLEVARVLDAEKRKLGKTKGDKVDKGKGKRQGEHGEDAVGSFVQLGVKATKRKREVEDVEAEVEKVGRGKKKAKVGAKEGEEEEDGKEKSSRHSNQGGKQRFILFVGNFKYTTSKEAIQAHFASCDPRPEIRLLTPKPKPGIAARPKSKGCAFLEFKAKSGLQQALKLHQSMLDGRMINVELTAGGGGKSESRLNKVKERNKELLNQRQKKVEIQSKSKKPQPADATLSRPDRPQRYSKTSGLDEVAPAQKRTWTVGDEVEEVHRGGKRRARGKKPSVAAAWGTGVNAIPVG